MRLRLRWLMIHESEFRYQEAGYAMKPPILIAHRGYAARYPENTLIALQAAVDAGAGWLEFDVQLSADRVPVLLHDTTLRRTAGRPDSVFALTADQLTARSAGESGRLGTRFDYVTIPTLAAVADWLRTQPRVRACVEIKTESIRRFGIEAVHRAVVHALGPAREQCVLISFDDAFLFAARLAVPMPIGWVVSECDEASMRRTRILAPDMLFVDQQLLPPEPEALWTGGWRWAVYEVTDAGQALALSARGIDFVETMAVGELLADARLAQSQATA